MSQPKPRFAVGDVVLTSDWLAEYDGLYVILAIELKHCGWSYKCHQIFCRQVIMNARSFSQGKNEKVGHIDDLTNFLADK